jgi:hypothetical protein
MMPVVSVLFIAILLGTYIHSPRAYTITEESIEINRMVGNLIIRRDEIKSIQLVDKLEVWRRIWASGGLFGYFGLFSLKGGKKAKVYTTRWNQVLLIKTKKKVYAISPAEPEKFCEAVNSN